MILLLAWNCEGPRQVLRYNPCIDSIEKWNAGAAALSKHLMHSLQALLPQLCKVQAQLGRRDVPFVENVISGVLRGATAHSEQLAGYPCGSQQ